MGMREDTNAPLFSFDPLEAAPLPVNPAATLESRPHDRLMRCLGAVAGGVALLGAVAGCASYFVTLPTVFPELDTRGAAVGALFASAVLFILGKTLSDKCACHGKAGPSGPQLP